MYYQPHPISSDMPAVLAIHGSASSGAQWQPLIDELDGQRIVLAPDLPGYGPAAEADEVGGSCSTGIECAKVQLS